MTYEDGDMRLMMDDDPKAPLRLSSGRLSIVRYVFLVHIEDGIPSAFQRAALEYADAILIGWPEEDAEDVVTPEASQYDFIAQQFDWAESHVREFMESERADKADDMADSLVQVADCIAAVRKSYQPEFLLPTFAEIRRVVEDEWNEDMGRIEAENREAHPGIPSDDAPAAQAEASDDASAGGASMQAPAPQSSDAQSPDDPGASRA